MYAYDTKLYAKINSTDDFSRLQEDHNQLAAWSTQWLLGFNEIKCIVMKSQVCIHANCIQPQAIPDTKGLKGAVARARPTVPLGLWSITSSLRGNLYVPRLHRFIKWFADNDVPHHN